MSYLNKLKTVTDMIRNSSERINQVTTDPTAIKPSNNSVSVWIKPPEVEWELFNEPSYTFVIYLVAGRPFSKNNAALELLETIEDMSAAHLNMSYAHPAEFTVEGIGDLAAYEISLKPLDL